MPGRDWKLRIKDILESIAAIQRYVAGMDFAAFAADAKTVDAVVRRFTIIGEAATYVPQDIQSAHPEIPWRDMRDMRHIMVHAYFGVNKQIVWDTIGNDLPPLVPLLTNLIA